MARKKKSRSEETKKWEEDLEIIKMLLILLVNKMGVNKRSIAKTLGVSRGRLSQILNPKKYKR